MLTEREKREIEAQEKDALKKQKARDERDAYRRQVRRDLRRKGGSGSWLYFFAQCFCISAMLAAVVWLFWL